MTILFNSLKSITGRISPLFFLTTMSCELRGPTPFEDMIFYLWTDSNEICTAYVKLNSKHILFMRIFLFSI